MLIPECIDKCTINEKAEKIAACAYICEMTHGYENSDFLEVINCFLNNQCFSEYPRDGICYGTDDDGVKSLTSLDQVFHDNLKQTYTNNENVLNFRYVEIGGSLEV